MKIRKEVIKMNEERVFINCNGKVLEISDDFKMFGIDTLWKLYEREDNERLARRLHEAFIICACALSGVIEIPEDERKHILSRGGK